MKTRMQNLIIVLGLCPCLLAATSENIGSGNTVDPDAVTEYSKDPRSFHIRDLSLGETKASVSKKYPMLSPLPSPSYTITLPEGESLYVQFSFNRIRAPSEYSMYLSAMSFRQDLGQSRDESCEDRRRDLQQELLTRFGKQARVSHVRGVRRLTWSNHIDDTSRIIATIYCRTDSLIFGLGAEGEYIDLDIERKMEEAREKVRLNELRKAEERAPKF
ncbi:MAG: hypothetical protein RQ736_05000 [Thiogranum sp.]|nr:hypothetical protein [Thiogranum sp.]